MLLVLLHLTLPLSHALLPPSYGDPAAPARVQLRNEGIQTQLRHSASWQSFLDGEGHGWTASFDERTGTPYQARGPSIDLGPLPDQAAVEAAMRSFVQRYPDMVGVSDKLLTLRYASYDASLDAWYVLFDRIIQGAPVWGGGFRATIRGGRLLHFSANTYPGFDDWQTLDLHAELAMDLGAQQGPIGLNDYRLIDARPVYLPVEENGELRLVLCWMTRAESKAPLGRFVHFVDGRSGKLLAWFNEYRFFSGTIYGTHDTRYPNGDYSTSPLPLLDLSSDGGNSTQAAEDGSFTANDGQTWNMELSGDWLTVNNDAGRDGSLSFSSGSPTWTTEDATQAEIDSYFFLHQVRTWLQDFNPSSSLITRPFTSNVNLSDVCNAYFDGQSVNFFQDGGGCNNTGRIADVNYHEWGHGLHYASVSGNAYPDGSISEGIGDVTSFLQTLDPIIAPYFTPDGGGIRRVDRDKVYPDDFVANDQYVHENGLIFGGAMWDLLGIMQDRYGDAQYVEKGDGWHATSQLFVDAIKANNTYDTVFDDFLAADDDNNDLSDGTPHVCQIIEAFGLHGLGPAGSGAGTLSLDHVALKNQPALTPIRFEGQISNLAPQCSDDVLDRIVMHWSTDGSTWSDVELSASLVDFEGEIPGLPDGTVVQYWIEGVSDSGSVKLPGNGEWAPYTFYVGELKEIWCESFEAGDGGFTHALLDGTNQEGADDWIYGTSSSLSGDPSIGFTGRKFWGNDLGGGQYNGSYQPNIRNRLSSIPVDTGGAPRLIVQYRRWLNVEDGLYDQARIYANEDEVWANHGSTRDVGDENTTDTDWVLHTLVLDGIASPLTLGWEIQSDAGFETGGWNIDDICVYEPAEPQPTILVEDFDASDDQDGEVVLTWTQPEAFAKAVVVRGDGAFPQNAQDGTVVFEGDVAAGSLITQTDAFVGTGHYAVFVGNGSTTLEGAEEGRNADIGTGLGDGVGPGGKDSGIILESTCGCAASPGSSGLGVLVLAGLALRRRRKA